MACVILDKGVLKMTKEAELSKEAERLVDMAARLMGGQAERMLLTLSQGEYGALLFLSRQEGGVTSNTIGRAMRIGPGGVANLLKALEQKGFVVKEHSREDRRANCVSITEEGRRRLAERSGQVMSSVLRRLQEIGLDDARAFNDMLERFLAVSVKFDPAEQDGGRK